MESIETGAALERPPARVLPFVQRERGTDMKGAGALLAVAVGVLAGQTVGRMLNLGTLLRF